jgi:hypothetical protein
VRSAHVSTLDGLNAEGPRVNPPSITPLMRFVNASATTQDSSPRSHESWSAHVGKNFCDRSGRLCGFACT